MNKFKKELEHLINHMSLENKSDTPDFILSDFMVNVFESLNNTINRRESFFGRKTQPIQTNILNETLPDTVNECKCCDCSNELSASEALFGFCGWLSSRKEELKISSTNKCGILAELIEIFCKANNLKEPREKWNEKLIHPKIKKE